MSTVLLTQDAGVAVITLNRPERCNALCDRVLGDLNAALDKLERMEPARAVVLRAAGRHFSTGGDVARFAEQVAAGNGKAYARRVVGGLNRAILRLARLPCPVLAEVSGAVTGGALGLVLAADLVAMERRAFIQPFYAQVGFAPDGGWTAMLPDRIGPHRARALLLLDSRISADEALAMGLAHSVSDAPAAAIERWLGSLSLHGPGAMAVAKRLIADLPALEIALEAEREAFLARIDTTEAREGMARFLSSLKGA